MPSGPGPMDLVLGQFLAGLSYGSTLFLVSAGLTLIFGVTRVVNFAHGALYMLGAYLAVSLTGALPSSPGGHFLGVLLAAFGVALAGIVIELIVLRRIYAAPEIFQLLATFGVALVIQDLALAVWGPEELFAPRAPGLGGALVIGEARVPEYNLFLTLVGPAIYGALWWIVNRTRWGTVVRAATQDREMAAALGVNERLLFTAVFAAGAGLAGLAGALQIPRETVNLQMDLTILVEAFVVVVVGGSGFDHGRFLGVADDRRPARVRHLVAAAVHAGAGVRRDGDHADRPPVRPARALGCRASRGARDDASAVRSDCAARARAGRRSAGARLRAAARCG